MLYTVNWLNIHLKRSVFNRSDIFKCYIGTTRNDDENGKIVGWVIRKHGEGSVGQSHSKQKRTP